jgi:outer membrane lipoprotein SlyB
MTLDRIAWFVGEIARPLSIFVATIGATAAGIIASLRIENGNDGALLLAAIGAYAGGLFGLKAVEVWKGSKDAASVEIAKVQSPNP